MKNLPTLRNDSSFVAQFSILVSRTRAILLFKIKISLIEMFELNERIPEMRSAEYQATIPLKFSVYDICRLQTADCRLQTADCRPQTADCRPQTADCRLQTADRRLQTA